MKNTLKNLYEKVNKHNEATEYNISLEGLVSNVMMQGAAFAQITLLTESFPDAGILCDAEEAFEKALKINEVLIHIPVDDLKPENYRKYLQWALRHLTKQNPFLGMIFNSAEFEFGSDDGNGYSNEIKVILHGGIDEAVMEEGCKFLAEFYKKRTCMEIRFSLYILQVDINEALQHADKAAKLQFFETHASVLSGTGQQEKESQTSNTSKPKTIREGKVKKSADGLLPAKLGEGKGAHLKEDKNASSANNSNNKQRNKDYKAFKQPEGVVWGKMNSQVSLVPMNSLNNETGQATIEGVVFAYESRPVSNGTKTLVKFCLSDKTNSIKCTAFMKPSEAFDFDNLYKESYIRILANIEYDAKYEKDLVAKVMGIQPVEQLQGKKDLTDVKRVELHAHTKMSSKDAVCDVKDLVSKAVEFGHEAIAITDHGVVQSFPEAREACKDARKKGKNIKIIYGMECYLVDDGRTVAYFCDENTLDRGYVAIKIVTTDINAGTDRILEFAAVLFEKNDLDSYEPTKKLHRKIDYDKLGKCGNDDDAVNTAYCEDAIQAMMELEEFISLRPVVSDEALRTAEFLRYEGFRTENEKCPRVKFFGALVDTSKVIEFLYSNDEAKYEIKQNIHKAIEVFFRNNSNISISSGIIKNNNIISNNNINIGSNGNNIEVDLDNYEKSFEKSEELQSALCGEIDSDIFKEALSSGYTLDYVISDKKIQTLPQLNSLAGQISQDVFLHDTNSQYHCIILAKDQVGLYGIYRLVSESHLKYIFKERPRVPKSLMEFFKAGNLLGSACEAGEVFCDIMEHYDRNKCNYEDARIALSSSKVLQTAQFYDYLEIQPVGNNGFMLRTNERKGQVVPAKYKSENDLISLNRLVIDLADLSGKITCATCDVHFLRPADSLYRGIMQNDMGYTDAKHQPPLYFRTTDEMLEEFSFLDPAKAQEIVVSNPRKIADMIQDDVKPFPEGTFPPVISTAASDVEQLTWDTATKMYGRDGVVPELVRLRIEKELKSIIGNGFAVMYYIAHKLVKKSNDDGYLVGSRGSVGSSFVATLCGITEVNPLEPHYYCTECGFSEFYVNGEYQSGYDLPPRNCPHCEIPLARDGQDIPFETFLGFDGEKQPDIDLNFSSEYQPVAHKFIEEMFGCDHTFRAGTISGYAEKNAISIVNKYCIESNDNMTKAEILRLAMGLIGVKRTTGQHPGGIVVVPKERDVFDFTPVQCPADKTANGIITTHFDFNSLHDTILKLDILGHADPTMLKVLGDITGVDVIKIPVNDENVIKLFSSNEPLGLKFKTSSDSGTLGLPELGTFMARGMIKDTKPSRFYDLVQLMGLSHGTDVWKGNAQDLIKEGTCTITEVIGCRDGIMTTLVHYGLDPKEAFNIMEKVRKGKGLTEQQENLMIENNVPKWYIESCKKIKYMFPKAHAAAYSISSLRIAWFKVYRKTHYYCAFFTVRADEFDGRIMCRGIETVKHYLERFQPSFRIKDKILIKIDGKEEEFSSDKAQKMYYILELIEEMYARGVEFLPIDIYNSDATKFVYVTEDSIRPPLNVLPSLSDAVARNIVTAREKTERFLSREDFAKRAAIGDTMIKTLDLQGCLDDLPETTQIDLFSFI